MHIHKLIFIFILVIILEGCGEGYVTITEPNEGKVAWTQKIVGTSSLTDISESRVFLLISPNWTYGPWYVHPTETFYDGSWRIKAEFGRNPNAYPEDIGTEYTIVAIISNNRTLEGVNELRDIANIPESNKSSFITLTRTSTMSSDQ